jgi:broad specificity phosphatase PhoE
MIALYVTHPQVRMDADIPVPLWGLSDLGLARARAFARSGAVPPGAMVFSSRERKALELAELVAEAAGTLVMSDHLMGENDRSSTGFLPPALFEEAADAFFAHPRQSMDGWERAIDAQARIVETVITALDSVPGNVPAIFCGHGAVGTLLKCHVAHRPISRREDQGHTGGPGGGNGFLFDLPGRRLVSDWMPIEAISPGWERS